MSSRTLLFLDDEHIADTVRLSRVWEQPRPFGPVLTADRPWEGACVVRPNVVPSPDGPGYRMWYQVFTRRKTPGSRLFCYAESEDGIAWVKPELGLVEWRGSRANNIVLGDRDPVWALASQNVMHDPGDADPARRWKMLFRAANDHGLGLFAAFSPDGLRWRVTERPVGPGIGDRTTLAHDPDSEAPYVAFSRWRTMIDDYRRRVVYRTESADFLHWLQPEPVLVPDLDDPADLQFYGMPAFRYRDTWIGCVERLWSGADCIDGELVTSRDGRSWTRSRATFLPNGPTGAWDSRWINLAHSPPVERANEWLWLYHEGRPDGHERTELPRGSIGLSMLRRDRFAGLQAGPSEGYVTTRALRYDGGALTLNANCGAGSARVEIVDETGFPLPDFTYDDATPKYGDAPAWVPQWVGDPSLESLRGRDIALRVHLTRATLYAVTVAKRDAGVTPTP